MSSRVLKRGINIVTCKYNILTHKGIDLVSRVNGRNTTDDIITHSDGVVVWLQTGQKNNTKATGNASYGNCVKIKHSNGYYTLYAHLQDVKVKLNEKVSKGQVIGYMGNTGRSFGSHTHFEVRNEKDNRINPTPYIDSELPTANKITYQVYDNKKKKWLPNVKVNTNSYAGNFGNAVSGLKLDKLKYRVHDKIKNKWLPFVEGRTNYAGNLGNTVDGIQIENATYRVHIKNGGWLSWVSKVDNTNNGYAGIYGKEIDAIQIKKDNLK